MGERHCRVVLRDGEGEITEKKSRFIASVRSVSSEEEALAFVEGKRKEHWDARHHCYAYVIGMHQEYMRGCDDGEPAQTAGRPMLDVLLKEELTNVAVVVTRYFGGVLLGTGGLVRAYQKAVQAGLSNCVTAPVELGRRMHIATDYNGLGRITHLLREIGIVPEDITYGADVQITAMAPDAAVEAVGRQITDATKGAAAVSFEGPVYFAREGETVRFL